MSGHLGQWFVGPELRPWRIWFQKILIVAALLAFCASLPLPALRFLEAPQMTPTTVFGWGCLVFSRPHYPSNLLLLSAPLLCWLLRQCRRPYPSVVVVCLTIASLFAVFHAPSLAYYVSPTLARTPPIFDIGFQVWVAAHLLMAAALIIPTWGKDGTDGEREAVNSELDRLQKKWSSPSTSPPTPA